MKTSKRLLSLFLSLVMVITTCSVGMTAFAADENESVFTYVDDEGKAVKLTYSGLQELLNAYAPALISLLGDTLKGIGVNVDEVTNSDEPIYELIAQLSPTLIGLLSGSASASDVISGYAPYDDLKYGYLDDEDAAMDFWTLYAFCSSNKGASGDLGKYCTETIEKLNALLAVYSEAEATAEVSIDGAKASIFNLLGCDENDSFIADPTNPFGALFGASLFASREAVSDMVTTDGITFAELCKILDETNTYNGIDYTDFYNYYAELGRYIGIYGEDDAISYEDLIYRVFNTGDFSLGLTIKLTTATGSDLTVQTDFGEVTYTADEYYLDTLKKAVPVGLMLYALGLIDEETAAECNTVEDARDILSEALGMELQLNHVATLYEFLLLGFIDTGDFSYSSTTMNTEAYYSATRELLVQSGYFTSYEEFDDVADSLSATADDIAIIRDLYNELNAPTLSDFIAAVRANDSISPVARMYITQEINRDNYGQFSNELIEWETGTPLTAMLQQVIDGSLFYPGAYLYLNTFMGYHPTHNTPNYSRVQLLFEQTYLFTHVTQKYLENNTLQYSWNDLKPDSELAITFVNNQINGYINDFLDPETSIGGIIDSLLGNLLDTKIDLYNTLKDIYLNLADDPVGTIFKLLPILIVVLDELLVPVLFNGGATENTNADEYYNNGLGSFFELIFGDGSGDAGILKGLTQADGSSVGLGQLRWDLNTLLPDVLHWLAGDNAYTYTYYNATENEDGTVTYGETISGALGTKYNDAGERTYQIPVFLNIYTVDKLIATAALADITNDGLNEILTELIGFALDVVESYVAEHGEDIKSYTDANKQTPSNKGINNLSVALPALISAFGEKFNEKYNVSNDWSFGSFAVNENGFTYNTRVQAVKDLASSKADGAEIMDTFIDTFINGWINALIDFVHGIVADPDNDITSNIPIVTSLLNALDLFGETSVLTDILNGFFLMSRDNADSFTFEERENGYIGLSKLSAYFLLINIEPLVKIVINIVNSFPSDDADDEDIEDTEDIEDIYEDVEDEEIDIDDTEESPSIIITLLALVLDNYETIVDDYENLLTPENEAIIQNLIDSIDNILSTLLANTYINSYSVDKLDGILSGVVTFLVNHFGEATTNEILALVCDYLTVINAENANSRNGNGPVNAKKVYTNKNLSVLITKTYSLVEKIVNKYLGDLLPGDEYGNITGAINGLVSPSAIAVRSSSIDQDITKFVTWTELGTTKYANDLGYSIKAGDKDAFYENLVDSLGVIPAIVGVLLCSTGYYNNVFEPVIASICDSAGVTSYTTALAADATGKDAMLAILNPVSDLLNKFLEAPVNTLLSIIPAVVSLLDEATFNGIIDGAIAPILNEIGGLGRIVENLSPTFAQSVYGLTTTVGTAIDDVKVSINEILSLADWKGLAEGMTPAALVLAVYTIAIDIILNNDILSIIIPEEYLDLINILSKLDAVDVFGMLTEILSVTHNPTEVYWTFNEYVGKAANAFTYPAGISKSDAEDAVDSLDELVANIFPLLQSLGVLDQSSLPELVSGLLFTNEMLTKAATGIYGALEGVKVGDTNLSEILAMAGIDVTPAGFAKLLTDKSYGATYSGAANTLKSCTSWSEVKSLDWGFTDGTARAKQGFVNGFAAILRPFNDILAIFLAEGKLDIAGIATDVVGALTLSFNNADSDDAIQYSITLENSKLTVALLNRAEPSAKVNTIQVDLKKVLNELKLAIYGGNGYESAIIPLLEAFMCDNVKTYSQYIKDYNKAKDNLLLDILNPIMGFVDDVLEAPFDTVTKVLPNVAYFISNNGVSQLLNNLLSPLTQTVIGAFANNGLDINELIAVFAGNDLGSLVADLIGIDVDLTLDITNLNTCNIQDIVVPLLQSILKDKLGLVLPDFKWETIASHGTQVSNSKIVANQGEVLVAVLRYIADTLIVNAGAIKSLICSIDAVAKNSTIVNILTSVFNQLSMAHKDQIVQAVFYLLTQNPQNAFFDYRGFTYKNYSFTYPSSVSLDFLTILGPMLDGLIGGLIPQFANADLNGLISGLIYKDDIISSLAVGLYGAIEKVNINKSLNLAELLAQTDIDFTTDNVAKLLTDKAYGKTYASAAKVIEKAGSWSKVNKASLSWGVTDRDSFLHALCAVLRPIYGVLDVLLNDGSLGLFKLIYLPGSDGYTSAIVPLMEAFGLYNIKTQYQYRQDMSKEYDAILLDILNPLLDKVEDILNAPIQTLCDILPNLALFFANDGLLQLIENLLTPINALLDTLKPIVNVNDLLKAVGLDIDKEINKLGLGIKNFHFDIYDLAGSLKPIIGAENIVGILNSVLRLIKIGGAPLGLELMPIDWYKLASHGTVITNEPSQAATFGSRIYVQSDRAEVLVAVLCYLVETINYKSNLATINDLIGGLLGGADDSISGTVSNVLSVLDGDTDTVIADLCGLLETIA